MITLPDIATTLRDASQRNGMTQARLAEAAGISRRTLTHVLSGEEDFRLSTLMALADRLGLELLLVPKGAAAALAAGQEVGPPVRSVVTDALAALHARPGTPSDPATTARTAARPGKTRR
ncbi:helix-turn-helix transcriptional regulator [Roseateles chitosanitabidus]|jgi:transcriptional regulator with XRE-family HTH domain|uniref:helix-turn-helix transcriptional regulator n=1 Tax=Roseateles chitosanitabidus TaxID=65048 RepID=UPI00082FA37A|nr:helix-turn-helix transcriptional regulator [Roseateles chitosanitabidus]MBO9687826.1 helix-turn-helix domain-containing protein [Roseateles chitosanitabidus]